MIFPPELESWAARLVRLYAEAGRRIVTAESCTGGLVAGLLTEVPGSSAAMERGFVTYSNEAKTECLGVPPDLIAREGAVSEAVARAMAEGALRASRADVSVAITGVAGPGGGSEAKPVGLVHLGCATKADTRHVERRYGDRGRAEIRLMAIADALALLEEAASEFPPAQA